MADHHKGYAVPIGGVVAYKDAISPSGVGFDIACGNKAVLLASMLATSCGSLRKARLFSVACYHDDGHPNIHSGSRSATETYAFKKKKTASY